MIEEIVMPVALAGVELGDDVLEIGPGPGFTTDVLRGRTARLTAVELDEGLAESLRSRLQGSNVEVVQGDASALELPDGRFSGAASFNMLHHVPTVELQDRIFREVARVLQGGGVFVIADGDPRMEVDSFHEGDIYNPIAAADVPERLEAAGFTDVEVSPYDLGWKAIARTPA
jgi:SAM-dependent methyltransferase